MTISLTEIDAANAEMIGEITDTFTWNGKAYACAASELTEGHRLGEAGIFDDDVLTIITRTALFSTRPAVQDQVTYNSKTLTIINVRTSPDDLVLTLACQEATA